MQLRDVHICETGPRDGLQNLSTFVPTAAKFALIDAIAASGAPEIDAGSFVPPTVVPQFADVNAVVGHALTHRELITGALVPNLRGRNGRSPPAPRPSISSSRPAPPTTWLMFAGRSRSRSRDLRPCGAPSTRARQTGGRD